MAVHFPYERRPLGRKALLLALLSPLVGIGSSASPVEAGKSSVTVMTRNLYLRTDLGPVIASTSPSEFLVNVAAAFNQAQASDFAGRAGAWADEIERAKPDLVGLQEAVIWRTQSPADFSPAPNATTVAADFLALLMAELRARGLKYVVVVSQTGYDVEAPGLFAGGFMDVRLTQREVILVRKSRGISLANPQGGQYAARLTLPTAIGVPVALPWAWASVDGQWSDAGDGDLRQHRRGGVRGRLVGGAAARPGVHLLPGR